MNQSLVFSVFWKENELQRLIGTSCQWLVLLNVVLIRASNKAVHQLTTKQQHFFFSALSKFECVWISLLPFKTYYNAFTVMPLPKLHRTPYLPMFVKGGVMWNYAGSKTWHCQEWLEHLFSSNCACLSIWRLYLITEDNSGDWQCSCSHNLKK